MKRVLQVAIIFLVSLSAFAQCPPGDIWITSQLEIDDFFANNPTCDAVMGSLTIGDAALGSDITDLSGLSQISFVDGRLLIHGTNITDLSGLQVDWVGLDLVIFNNPLLQNIDNVPGTLGVGGDIMIDQNPLLSSIAPLQNVAFGVNDSRYIEINDNPSLTNLTGLQSLVQTGWLWITNNDGITNLDGLSNLQFIQHEIKFQGNGNLSDISGLTSIISNDFDIIITDNPSLATCNELLVCQALPNASTITISNNAVGCDSPAEVVAACNSCPIAPITLSSQAEINAFQTTYPLCTELAAGLTISGADIVDLSPLSVLTLVGNGFNIVNNPLLTSLGGLDNIHTIVSQTGDFQIRDNASLTSIAALSSLTGPVGSSIVIQDNPVLASLTGLDNVTRPGDDDLIIINNNALTSLFGLSSLEVSDDMLILDNDNLTSLAGMDANHTTGQFLLRNNDALTSLTGLGNFNPLCGFEVSDHAVLTDIDGFVDTFVENCTPNIIITNNPNLATCDIDFICTALPYVFDLDVANNAPGCDTNVEATLHCTVCPSQDVVLSSQQQVNDFAALYPNCSSLNVDLTIAGTDISDLSGLVQVTEISGALYILNNPMLASLSGLGNINFPGVDGYIEIKNNDILTDVDALAGATSNNMSLLIKDNPILGSLSGFSGLTGSTSNMIEIENNDALIDFSGLEGFTGCDVLFVKLNDQLQDISALSNIVGSSSNIGISENPSLTSLNGLEGYTDVFLDLEIYDNDALEDLDGLAGFTNAGIPNNTTVLIISNNAMLADISGLENFQAISLIDVEIQDNPLLAMCDIGVVCDYIDLGGSPLISGNAAGCENIAAVVNSCGSSINILRGNVKFDFNIDGCDLNDYNASSILVTTTDGTNNYTTSTSTDGDYLFLLPFDGTFTTNLVASSFPAVFDPTPISATSDFIGFGNEEIVDFCLAAASIVEDLKITILPTNDARPGFDSDYLIVFENVGTVPKSGEVTLEFDDQKQTFQNASIVPDDMTTNLITWNYTDLLPLESRSISIEMNNFPPPVNEDGDELGLVAFIYPVSGDAVPMDNDYEIKQIMVNSQDPNDKLVAQGAEIYFDEVGNYLEYVVRFQNIGSASAINVRVDDVLSANLDWDTFRILDASHEYRLEIIDGNQVSFIFDGINLPSVNTDPEGSNGYVAFQVRSLNTLVVGNSVENTANIYFDFNAPIETNTVTTTVVENLGVDEFPLHLLIDVYPNPASQLVHIDMADGVELLQTTLYSVLGNPVVVSKQNSVIVSTIAAGIYFFEIRTNKGTLVKKIVKQ